MITGTQKASRSLALATGLGVLLLCTTGCTEKTTVTLHEPGVYKGDADPLLAMQKDPEQIKTLQQRFVRGQTDR
jgi:hypothetical protein